MEKFVNENSLFVDPNAYVFGVKKEPKKIVFSEPYECLPSYYPNNDFKKGKCDCVAKPKHKDCEREKKGDVTQKKFFGLDFKSLMPILSMLGGGGLDLSKIISILGNNSTEQNPMSMISSLMQNSGGLGNILNLFKPKTSTKKAGLKSTDFEITNYTRVE